MGLEVQSVKFHSKVSGQTIGFEAKSCSILIGPTIGLEDKSVKSCSIVSGQTRF